MDPGPGDPLLSVVLLRSGEKPSVEAERKIAAFFSLKKIAWETVVAERAQEGMSRARGRYILLTDTALQTPIKESDKLIAALEKGADVAIGSRRLRAKDCDVRQSFRSAWLGGISAFFLQLFFLPGIRDPHCAFKVFTHEAAKKIFSSQPPGARYSDVPMLRLARKLRCRIVEVPVMWAGA